MENVVHKRPNVNQDDNDSGFNSDEEALSKLFFSKKKRTKARQCYRKSNAAILPAFIPPEERKETDCSLKETQVWSSNNLNRHQILDFIFDAKFECGFNTEQALALIHSNGYKIIKAKHDLKIFAPLPSQWPEDRSIFISALRAEEKHFHKIKNKFFPKRSVTDMVEYYYTWKMEKKRKKFKAELKKAKFLKSKKTLLRKVSRTEWTTREEKKA